MNLFALSCVITSIVSLIIGIFSYFRNKSETLNKLWLAMSLSVSLWSIGLFGVINAHNLHTAFFWQCLLDIGAIFIPVIFFHFVLIFLEINQKKAYRIPKIIVDSIGILLVIISPFSIFKKGVAPLLGFNFWINPGRLYFLFPLFFITVVICSFYFILKSFPNASEIKKAQIKYVLIASLVGFGGGMTNFFPQFIKIYPFGNFFVVFYLLFVVYAIFKHHLFDVRVIATELLVAAIALILLVQALTADTTLLKIWGIAILLLFSIAGISLIQSVVREIRYREELSVAKEKVEQAKERLEKAYALERQSHEELKRLDEARKQFILATQHHLRTPLTIMKGYVSMILEGSYGKVDPKTMKPLSYFQESTEKLIKLVNELLDISQFQMGRGVLSLQDVQLEDILADIVKELKPETDKRGLYLTFEKPKTPLPKVKADSSRMKLALANVVDNGVKYTTQGGVTVKIKDEKSNIKIEVKDTGIGMEKEETEFLFGRFFERGDAAKRTNATGRGIGLALSDQIFRAHKGKIWVESEGKGKGSTFHIEIPKNQTNNDQNKQIQ